MPSHALPSRPRFAALRAFGGARARRIPALAVLGAVCLVSLAARVAWLGDPCRAPCRKADDHILIFDEHYYVNAARVIAGMRLPPSAPYAQTPPGDDGNAEHPQIVKVAMAGLIELLGDGPLAWRLPVLLLGTVCLLGMYALARAAGAGVWLATGAAALMAADNLLLVHSRIATLDVPALAGMLFGVALYLRGRPIAAGAAIGVGACAKLVAPYAAFVVALLEVFEWLRTREAARRRLTHVLACGVSAFLVLIALLGVLGLIAPPFDNSARKPVHGGPFAHLAHMFSYAATQTSPHGPTGIASYPWQWLVDSGVITYLNIDPTRPVPGLNHVHPRALFLGAASPPILLAGLIGLVLAAAVVVGGALRARRSRAAAASASPEPRVQAAEPLDEPSVQPAPLDEPSVQRAPLDEPPVRTAERMGRWSRAASIGAVATHPRLDATALAWFLGTFLPFVFLSAVLERTSYLYYMVVVMPALYLAAAGLAARCAPYPRLRGLWVVAVAVAAVLMYPFVPIL